VIDVSDTREPESILQGALSRKGMRLLRSGQSARDSFDGEWREEIKEREEEQERVAVI
jgi:hypothetical protein